MGDTFDPYREALVVERVTLWPDELTNIDPAERERLEQQLHADPQKAGELAYVRLPTGFSRQITVTTDDIQRLRSR
jgi:hypothetical protein